MRDATHTERHTFFRWMLNGHDPVAPHLLAEGMVLQVNDGQKERYIKTDRLTYSVNMNRIAAEVKAIKLSKGKR